MNIIFMCPRLHFKIKNNHQHSFPEEKPKSSGRQRLQGTRQAAPSLDWVGEYQGPPACLLFDFNYTPGFMKPKWDIYGKVPGFFCGSTDSVVEYIEQKHQHWGGSVGTPRSPDPNAGWINSTLAPLSQRWSEQDPLLATMSPRQCLCVSPLGISALLSPARIPTLCHCLALMTNRDGQPGHVSSYPSPSPKVTTGRALL